MRVSTRQLRSYGTGGGRNRYAHSAGPGLTRNSKLDLGTFKFEPGASDLPPEGSKKRSCFADSAGAGSTRNSKLDLGTFKFESGASDLPPEGSKKRSCVEILDLFVKTATGLVHGTRCEVNRIIIIIIIIITYNRNKKKS